MLADCPTGGGPPYLNVNAGCLTIKKKKKKKNTLADLRMKIHKSILLISSRKPNNFFQSEIGEETILSGTTGN